MLVNSLDYLENEKLESLLDSTPSLWRGQRYRGHARSLSTGFDALDEALPTGGWPPGAVVELMVPSMGIGELSLWLPVIKRMTEEQRYVIIANPPYMPYAPALANAGVDLEYVKWLSLDDEQDTLWALEKALRNRECGMALWWPGTKKGSLADSAVRHLQLAAREGESLLGLYRVANDDRGIRQSTWAALRLQLRIKQEGGLDIDILKARGSHRQHSVSLATEAHTAHPFLNVA